MKLKIIAFFLLIALVFSCSFAISAGGEGFYVIRNREHKQPTIDQRYAFIENYACYYVDKTCADASEKKKIYLTFDAGYENGNVAKILDILKEKEVPAAFFVLGYLVVKHPKLVTRMGDEGHLVCNHTNRHPNMKKIHDKEAFMKELLDLENNYRRVTGREIDPFFRPPEGAISEEGLSYLSDSGYTTVFWSFAYADWDNGKQMSPEKAKKKVFDYTHNGAILLLHPTSDTNVKILGDCIDKWRSEGYTFGTLYELSRKEA